MNWPQMPKWINLYTMPVIERSKRPPRSQSPSLSATSVDDIPTTRLTTYFENKKKRRKKQHKNEGSNKKRKKNSDRRDTDQTVPSNKCYWTSFLRDEHTRMKINATAFILHNKYPDSVTQIDGKEQRHILEDLMQQDPDKYLGVREARARVTQMNTEASVAFKNKNIKSE